MFAIFVKLFITAAIVAFLMMSAAGIFPKLKESTIMAYVFFGVVLVGVISLFGVVWAPVR